jgi:PIN domain nuclease of toxin-antitoxin system
MIEAVLDASAVLAVINDEPGAEIVIEILEERALLSAVNYAEVMTKLVERGMDRRLASATVLNIGVQVIEFEIDLAERAGELRLQTKLLGLSLADRACLALAEREKVPALTADRNWGKANLGIDVRVIR